MWQPWIRVSWGNVRLIATALGVLAIALTAVLEVATHARADSASECSGYTIGSAARSSCEQMYAEYSTRPTLPSSMTTPREHATVSAPSGGAPPDFDQDPAPIAPRADVGDADALSQVRDAVVADLTNFDLAQVQPPGRAARSAAVASSFARSARNAELAKAWAPSALADKEADVQSALDAAASDPNTRSLLNARFDVLEWQGVQISGSSATALFVGREELQFEGDSGDWIAGGPEQYLVRLVAVRGDWLMQRYTATAADPGSDD